MEKFIILVEETLATTIPVKAETSEDAVSRVEEMYGKQEIILGGDDFSEVIIKDMNVE